MKGSRSRALICLLKSPGEVVSREELHQQLWPADTFVNFEHGLNAAVKRLRQALNDSADNPRFVETLPRRGYRFIAPIQGVGAKDDDSVAGEVRLIKQDAATGDLPEIALDPSEKAAVRERPRWPHAWTISGFAVFLVLAVFTVWILRPPDLPPRAIRSLAVLPLENLSGDVSQDYFSDGMTDELITELGQIGELRVISRTSIMTYKGTRKSLPQIARELNVDAVVEGTVLRSGQQVRITAHPIQAAVLDKHLWAQSYEGDLRDTLALQQQVASSIAREIRDRVDSSRAVCAEKRAARESGSPRRLSQGPIFLE